VNLCSLARHDFGASTPAALHRVYQALEDRLVCVQASQEIRADSGPDASPRALALDFGLILGLID
jgi:hypothetical protein